MVRDNTTPILTEKKYSVPHAARLLGISRTNCYALIHQGHLPAYKIGSKLVVLESDLQSYLEQAKYTPVKNQRSERRKSRKRRPIVNDLIPKGQRPTDIAAREYQGTIRGQFSMNNADNMDDLDKRGLS